MVFPLFDDNTGRRTFPVVNYAFIVLNFLVWVGLQQMSGDSKFTWAYSTVPREIVTGEDVKTDPEDREVRDQQGRRHHVQVPGLEETPIPVYLTLLTAMFMHGSWAHLLGNMLFLWIFGDNVEDDLGHARYFLFYIVCGIVAGLAHVFVTVLVSGVASPASAVPSLGASGAISGVLGGYILRHPHRRVTVIMFRFLTQVPAYVAIGLWFGMQLLMGLTDLGGEGGVAYGAHIGGFVAGVILVNLFAIGHTPPPPRATYPNRRW